MTGYLLTFVCTGQPHGGRRRLYVAVPDINTLHGWTLRTLKFGGPRDAVVVRNTPGDDGKAWAARGSDGRRRTPVRRLPFDGGVSLPCPKCRRNPTLHVRDFVKLCETARDAGVSEIDLANLRLGSSS